MRKLFIGIIAILLIFPAFALAVPAEDENDGDEVVEEPQDITDVIEQQYRVVEDPDVVGRVETISERLLAVIPMEERRGKEVIFKVLDDDSVNAFAIPTGNIYLFTGLLDASETDDMLAGVMAHEMVHVFHKHHTAMGERQLRGMLIGIAATIATGQVEGLMLGDMLSAGMIETYGRHAENDADATSTKWVVEAGFDPRGLLELMQILEQVHIHRPTPGGNYFSVHPDPAAREENIRNVLREMGIELPENLYRVHLPIEFHLPLSDEDEAVIMAYSESTSPADEDEDNEEAEIDYTPPDDIVGLLMRKEIFTKVISPSDLSYGVITVGDEAVFYITEESDEALQSRADGIITRLKGKFEEGLRNYDVQVRTLGGVPAVMAELRRIIYTTESDAALIGLSVDETNRQRKDTLKDVLYRYEVDRKI